MLWLSCSCTYHVHLFFILKQKTCTTISHAPQKAIATEAGNGHCLSALCKELPLIFTKQIAVTNCWYLHPVVLKNILKLMWRVRNLRSLILRLKDFLVRTGFKENTAGVDFYAHLYWMKRWTLQTSPQSTQMAFYKLACH